MRPVPAIRQLPDQALLRLHRTLYWAVVRCQNYAHLEALEHELRRRGYEIREALPVVLSSARRRKR